MYNLANFVERLSELIFDSKIDIETLSNCVNLTPSCIYRYLRGESMPEVKNVIKLADYFKCSTDFLLGLENENYTDKYNNAPAWSERFKFLLKHFKISKYKLARKTGLSESGFYTWQSGESQLSVESLVKLAEFFVCSTDFILGR